MEPIQLHQLSFAYPGQEPLFDHCSLDLSSDWKLGLLGRNGRGKTTLLKILCHQLDYTGSVTAKLNFSYFPLRITDPDQLAREALLTAISDQQLADWQIARELNLMGTDPAILWQPYNILSGGEQTRVQLATLFAQSGHFLLLDEPTNHLDQASRKQVAAYLTRKQQGFIVTSHDRTFLDQVINHVLVIERHQLVLGQGNYTAYTQQKHRRDQEAQASNHQLQAEIKDLRKSRQRQLQWATQAENKKKNNSHADKGFLGAKAARLMKKSTSTNNRLTRAIEDRKGLLAEVDDVDRLPINLVASHHQVLLTLDRVSLTIAGRQLFAPVSFRLGSHDQVAIVGRNGTGKSSLFKAICGQFAGEQDGTIRLAHGVKISLVRQDCHNHGTLRHLAAAHHLPFERLLTILKKLGMPRKVFRVPIQEMSMGQQKKVELARSLATPAQLYFWDEPLNYLDVVNQDQLCQLIADFRPPLLFAEHDQHFIDTVASQQVQIVPPVKE